MVSLFFFKCQKKSETVGSLREGVVSHPFPSYLSFSLFSLLREQEELFYHFVLLTVCEEGAFVGNRCGVKKEGRERMGKGEVGG
jgi:hypothetical protein